MSDDLQMPEISPQEAISEDRSAGYRYPHAKRYQRWFDIWLSNVSIFGPSSLGDWLLWTCGSILVFVCFVLPPILFVLSPFIHLFASIIILWWRFWMSMAYTM